MQDTHAIRALCVPVLVLLMSLMAPSVLPAQTFIEEVKFRVIDPQGAVRPLEEAILEVQVYGTLRSKNGSETRGMLPLDGAWIAFAEKNSGWVSKAFQCPDFNPRSYVRERRGNWMDILGAVQDFTLKSCYVYTAPERPGKYRLQASVEGVAGDVYVEVSASAPSRRRQEQISFDEESRSRDPYLPLVEHYAPFVAQEAWFNPLADAITRTDYDGDWHGDNNWDNLGVGSSQAYVYYAVMETESHWFLHYNFFHPRDYSDTCLLSSCHENDNEGMILAVRKDGSRFGKAEAMQTLAHNILLSYTADDTVGPRLHEVKAPLVMYEGSHPMVFIEAGGHGVTGIADRTYSLFDHHAMEWLPGAQGFTYVYKGAAERPRHAGATSVGYALLPIYEHWWLRSNDASGRVERTFADYYTYAPYGNRPTPPQGQIAGAFLGIKESANKAKPFWGWHDERSLKAGVLATGQWGLDPAYGFAKNLRFPDTLPYSLDYTFNPYLGVGTVEGAALSQSSPQREVPAASEASPADSGWGDSGTKAPAGWGEPANQGQGGWGDPPAPPAEQAKPQEYPRGWGTPSNPGTNPPNSQGERPQGWDPPR